MASETSSPKTRLSALGARGRVALTNLTIALHGRCRCTDRALEDLEPSFVDDPAPGLTRTGSLLSYLTIPNTSSPPELEEFEAPPENIVPVPIWEPSGVEPELRTKSITLGAEGVLPGG